MDTVLFALLMGKIKQAFSKEKLNEAVSSYLEENPISSGATEEQVAQIEENKTNIANKLDKNQGAENSGKFIGINTDGDIIPTTLSSPTETERGGIKAKAKTTETVEVAVGDDDKLYVPEYPNVDNKIESPSSASVGQVISVKSVDETGRPTEYEAVNMSEGEVIDVDAELKSYFKELKPAVVSTINAKGGDATTTDSFTELCTTGIESIPNGIVATETLPMQAVLTATYSALSPDGITLNYEDVGAYGYLIVRKESSKPITTADGIIVYKGSYQSGFVDKDVILEKTYYYRIFPYNSKNQYQSYEGQSVAVCDYKSRSDQKQVKDLVLDDTIAFGYFNNQVFTWKVVDTQSENGAMFAAEQNCGNMVWDQPENATDNANPITNRKNQGNNRWAYSNIRQWLNSEAAAGEWYTAQHEYDVAPSYKTWAGFLNLFTEAEKDAIVLRTNTCILDKNDGGGTETVQDRIWFPSSYEAGKEITKEGYKFEKYDNTNASTVYQSNWWLRTINNALGTAETASFVRYVYSGGNLSSGGASVSYSARPFCQLKSDTWLTWSDTLAAYVLADDSQRTWAA